MSRAIRMGDNDAAFIFRKGGAREAIIPKEVDANGDVLPHTVMVAVAAMLFSGHHDDEIERLARKFFPDDDATAERH